MLVNVIHVLHLYSLKYVCTCKNGWYMSRLAGAHSGDVDGGIEPHRTIFSGRCSTSWFCLVVVLTYLKKIPPFFFGILCKLGKGSHFQVVEVKNPWGLSRFEMFESDKMHFPSLQLNFHIKTVHVLVTFTTKDLSIRATDDHRTWNLQWLRSMSPSNLLFSACFSGTAKLRKTPSFTEVNKVFYTSRCSFWTNISNHQIRFRNPQEVHVTYIKSV